MDLGLDLVWDLDADILDPACVRVVLVACGSISARDFARISELVRACAVVPVGGDARSEAMRLRFLGEWALGASCIATNDEWRLLQPHAQPRAVLGLCIAHSTEERTAACAELRARTAHCPAGVAVRCFAFDAADELFADAHAEADLSPSQPSSPAMLGRLRSTSVVSIDSLRVDSGELNSGGMLSAVAHTTELAIVPAAADLAPVYLEAHMSELAEEVERQLRAEQAQVAAALHAAVHALSAEAGARGAEGGLGDNEGDTGSDGGCALGSTAASASVATSPERERARLLARAELSRASHALLCGALAESLALFASALDSCRDAADDGAHAAALEGVAAAQLLNGGPSAQHANEKVAEAVTYYGYLGEQGAQQRCEATLRLAAHVADRGDRARAVAILCAAAAGDGPEGPRGARRARVLMGVAAAACCARVGHPRHASLLLAHSAALAEGEGLHAVAFRLRALLVPPRLWSEVEGARAAAAREAVAAVLSGQLLPPQRAAAAGVPAAECVLAKGCAVSLVRALAASAASAVAATAEGGRTREGTAAGAKVGAPAWPEQLSLAAALPHGWTRLQEGVLTAAVRSAHTLLAAAPPAPTTPVVADAAGGNGPRSAARWQLRPRRHPIGRIATSFALQALAARASPRGHARALGVRAQALLLRAATEWGSSLRPPLAFGCPGAWEGAGQMEGHAGGALARAAPPLLALPRIDRVEALPLPPDRAPEWREEAAEPARRTAGDGGGGDNDDGGGVASNDARGAHTSGGTVEGDSRPAAASSELAEAETAQKAKAKDVFIYSAIAARAHRREMEAREKAATRRAVGYGAAAAGGMQPRQHLGAAAARARGAERARAGETGAGAGAGTGVGVAWVCGEGAEFALTLSNPLSVELALAGLWLETAGVPLAQAPAFSEAGGPLAGAAAAALPAGATTVACGGDQFTSGQRNGGGGGEHGARCAVCLPPCRLPPLSTRRLRVPLLPLAAGQLRVAAVHVALCGGAAHVRIALDETGEPLPGGGAVSARAGEGPEEPGVAEGGGFCVTVAPALPLLCAQRTGSAATLHSLRARRGEVLPLSVALENIGRAPVELLAAVPPPVPEAAAIAASALGHEQLLGRCARAADAVLLCAPSELRGSHADCSHVDGGDADGSHADRPAAARLGEGGGGAGERALPDPPAYGRLCSWDALPAPSPQPLQGEPRGPLPLAPGSLLCLTGILHAPHDDGCWSEVPSVHYAGRLVTYAPLPESPSIGEGAPTAVASGPGARRRPQAAAEQPRACGPDDPGAGRWWRAQPLHVRVRVRGGLRLLGAHAVTLPAGAGWPSAGGSERFLALRVLHESGAHGADEDEAEEAEGRSGVGGAEDGGRGEKARAAAACAPGAGTAGGGINPPIELCALLFSGLVEGGGANDVDNDNGEGEGEGGGSHRSSDRGDGGVELASAAGALQGGARKASVVVSAGCEELLLLPLGQGWVEPPPSAHVPFPLSLALASQWVLRLRDSHSQAHGKAHSQGHSEARSDGEGGNADSQTECLTREQEAALLHSHRQLAWLRARLQLSWRQPAPVHEAPPCAYAGAAAASPPPTTATAGVAQAAAAGVAQAAAAARAELRAGVREAGVRQGRLLSTAVCLSISQLRALAPAPVLVELALLRAHTAEAVPAEHAREEAQEKVLPSSGPASASFSAKAKRDSGGKDGSGGFNLSVGLSALQGEVGKMFAHRAKAPTAAAATNQTHEAPSSAPPGVVEHGAARDSTAAPARAAHARVHEPSILRARLAMRAPSDGTSAGPERPAPVSAIARFSLRRLDSGVPCAGCAVWSGQLVQRVELGADGVAHPPLLESALTFVQAGQYELGVALTPERMPTCGSATPPDSAAFELEAAPVASATLRVSVT